MTPADVAPRAAIFLAFLPRFLMPAFLRGVPQQFTLLLPRVIQGTRMTQGRDPRREEDLSSWLHLVHIFQSRLLELFNYFILADSAAAFKLDHLLGSAPL